MASRQWKNVGTSGNWNNPDNWTGKVVPDSSDHVTIDAGSSDSIVTIPSGFDANADTLTIVGHATGNPKSSTTLALAGGTLTATNRSRGKFVTGRRYIDRNLRSASLDAGQLSKTFGISRAALYRLFEPVGGVAIHIREALLRLAWQEIVNGDGDGVSRLIDWRDGLGRPN